MTGKHQTRSGRFSFSGFLLVLIFGAVAGSVFTYLVLQDQRQSQPGANIQPGDELGEAREAIEAYIERKLREWNLDPEQLKLELERGGQIVREKSREMGTNLPGEFSDVTIIAKIKAKYTLDRELSGWNIIVGCENGHVTLSGRVDSPSDIGRAVVMALDADGVIDVVSTLTVR
jgi:hypothetical protein